MTSLGDPGLRTRWCDGQIARVTSTDVAREAGVSQSTVSLVLSGKGAGRVSDTTADSVRAAAERLGYRPNAIARSLRTGSAGAICLAVPDVTNPFFATLLRGASRAAAQAGLAVALVDVDGHDTWEDAGVQRLRGAGSVDGFLLFGAQPPAEARHPGAEPVVLVDTDGEGLSSVRLDAHDGVSQAMDHLLELGHTQIGHLASSVLFEPTFRLREQAYAEALRGRALPVLEPERTGFTFTQAEQAGGRLLDRPDRPTAVVCDDDLLATGLVLAARARGVRIPQELSIVGFDDLEIATVVDPPLTTVRADAAQMGATAVALLLERLADPAGPPRRVVQAVALVVRGSTAPPPG